MSLSPYATQSQQRWVAGGLMQIEDETNVIGIGLSTDQTDGAEMRQCPWQYCISRKKILEV